MRATDHLEGLSPTFVRDILDYSPETGEFTFRYTRGGVTAGSRAGFLRPDGYVQIKIHGRAFLAHRLAWFWVHGAWPSSEELDHINRNKADNRIDNLREATFSLNRTNLGLRASNRSGATGVCLVHERGKPARWLAYIRVDGKMRKLGRHKTKEGAMAARLSAEKEAA